MFTLRARSAFGMALLSLLVVVTGVLADVIDGQWCAADGRRIRIDGESITTPGGKKIEGEYDRHHYLFTVPAHERNAGSDVDMVLVSDNIMHLRYQIGANERSDMAPEVWTRCEEPLS